MRRFGGDQIPGGRKSDSQRRSGVMKDRAWKKIDCGTHRATTCHSSCARPNPDFACALARRTQNPG